MIFYDLLVVTAPVVVILAAGQGTRMRSATPKLLHTLCGRPMIAWPVAAARAAGAAEIVVVDGPERRLDSTLNGQATIAVHRGRLPLARAYLRRAVRRDPSDVQAWADLGQVLALRGDSGGADHAARRLLELDPHGPWVPASERSRLATESRAASGAVQTPPAAK